MSSPYLTIFSRGLLYDVQEPTAPTIVEEHEFTLHTTVSH